MLRILLIKGGGFYLFCELFSKILCTLGCTLVHNVTLHSPVKDCANKIKLDYFSTSISTVPIHIIMLTHLSMQYNAISHVISIGVSIIMD